MKNLTEEEITQLMRSDEYQNKYNPKFEETQKKVSKAWENLYPEKENGEGFNDFEDMKKNPENYYIWSAVFDSRTRSSHADRDGQVFCWDYPPEDGHPGEDYNCRCTAEPYVPTEKDKVSGYDRALYGIAAASQGYSLGFSDEIEGVVNGAGHVIAKGADKIYTNVRPHLAEKHPNLPKNIYDPKKSFGEAFKDGYKSQRDERRAFLEEGKKKAPVVTGIAEATGAIASPVKILKVSKYAPPKVISRINLIDAALIGGVYGFGAAKGDWKNHAINTGVGTFAGGVGRGTIQKLDRAVTRSLTSQAVRSGVNNYVEQGVGNLIEDIASKPVKKKKD